MVDGDEDPPVVREDEALGAPAPAVEVEVGLPPVAARQAPLAVAEAVAAGRGNRLTKEAALATEAACFYGDEAVDAGLADAVARPTEAFAEFVAMF